MPKSKRGKLVSLGSVGKKKGRKVKLAAMLRKSIDERRHIYVIELHNERNQLMKQFRKLRENDQMYIGKNKVMQVTLGMRETKSYKPEIYKISQYLYGHCLLMLSDQPPELVLEFFKNFEIDEYPKTGTVATQTVVQPAGALPYPVKLSKKLIDAGMNVQIDNGTLKLNEPFEVCKEGQVLNPHQSWLVKLMDIKMAKFRGVVRCHWSRGKFDAYQPIGEDQDGFIQKMRERAARIADERIKEEKSRHLEQKPLDESTDSKMNSDDDDDDSEAEGEADSDDDDDNEDDSE